MVSRPKRLSSTIVAIAILTSLTGCEQPPSQRSAAALARFYHDNGQRSESLSVLRQAGMLLEAQRPAQATPSSMAP